MSNPWMKFFPADWRSDSALRLCSRAARGTWIDMLSIMHEATPYGELRVNGTALDARGLAKLLGEMVEDIIQDLEELERCGVFSRKKNGVIYSRRMEKDENLRRKKAENGKKGGNPSLRKQTENDDLDNHQDKPQKPEARSQKPDIDISLPSEAPPSAGPDDLDEALAAYNSAADAAGWPQARTLSKARRSSLKARLRECGGVQGWGDAMARARASPFLTGGNSRDWLPSLDFFLQAKSFTKLLEGAYDRRDSPARSAPAAQGTSGPSQRIAAMAEILAERNERRIQADNFGGFGPDRRPETDNRKDDFPAGRSFAARVG